ncbi:exocyst complex component 1-like [Ornithodoros turicata]|uniref:exocyst complex component 1-like n=1 Tax=Ornithodoros turicata TaxID=34597 RepID=UPI003139E378
MAATRHSLQSELFRPNDERLVDFVSVVKATKKKKISFLCAVVSTDKPVRVTIWQVKNTDKDAYKKKNSWGLRDLKLVDGKSEADTAEFDLHFDKVYKWQAVSIPERNAFLKCLWRLCTHYVLQQRPRFENFPKGLLEEDDAKLATPEKGIADEVDDYQALTQREEVDLENLMAKYEFAINNAEAFTEQLARELSSLDASNVHTIMESERRVQGLMEMTQAALDELSRLERRLDAYDDLLRTVRDSVLRMEEKDAVIHIQHNNNMQLLRELESVVNQLDLSHQHQMALLNGELRSHDGIQACTAAAKALEDAMNAQIHPGLARMSAVQEQFKLFDKLKDKFSTTLSHQLNKSFLRLGYDTLKTQNEITLTKHTGSHNELRPYTELMQWLKRADLSRYQVLHQVYINATSKLYEKEIRNFFEQAREKLSGKTSTLERRGTWTGGSMQDLSLAESAENRERFDAILERILSMLEPVCLAEQQFCVTFFGLSSKIHPSVSTHSSAALDASASLPSRASSDETLTTVQKKEKLLNEEVRKTMALLFPSLENELRNFLETYDKLDGAYSMHLLVRLNQHVMSAQDTGSFLSMTFGSMVIQAKRNFDRYMSEKVHSIEEAKAPKKSKCGILAFITQFEEFAQQAEAVFRGSDRRADLDKWYTRLVRSMFDAITKVSGEHARTPQEVVRMENFHHLFTLLYQLKIPCLEPERKEAKQRYSEALQAYVTHYFGRPLDKLNQFFEGVQNKVAQGVKEDEVGYQLAFSKQELRKVIKEYPGKEVKKGLESLYRKVEKHLCEEENLLQVVWHSMQDEFIRQYKYIESLVQRCYPGSMIMLEFSINDILAFFSDIARSH